MKKVNLCLLLTIFCSLCFARPVRVAVIDTGIDLSLKDKGILCEDGHKDLTRNNHKGYSRTIQDFHGHGTHVSMLIDQYAKNIILDKNSSQRTIHKLINKRINYCQVIIKYYNGNPHDLENATALTEAINYVSKLKNIDIVNISSGGTSYIREEAEAIKKLILDNVIVVAAAGNDGKKLGGTYFENGIKKTYTYYPAMAHKKVYVVGNGKNKNDRYVFSNYGEIVDFWEDGLSAISIIPSFDSYKFMLFPMTGTSQSTAIRTGKIVRNILLFVK